MILNINPYLALAVNGFCVGLGSVAANHIYTTYLKKRINKRIQRMKQRRLELQKCQNVK